MPSIAAKAIRTAIVAGGAARRFGGGAKGLATVGGRRMLDRVVEALVEATGTPPRIIADAPDAPGWRDDLEVIPDRVRGMGSLGGIYTAVVTGEGPVLVAAWDMPFLAPGLLAALAAGHHPYDAYLPESDGPRGFEPFCAVYGPSCGSAIERSLAAGDRRAAGFHAWLRVGTIAREDVARHGDPAVMFFNVNTADDLRRAEDIWSRHG